MRVLRPFPRARPMAGSAARRTISNRIYPSSRRIWHWPGAWRIALCSCRGTIDADRGTCGRAQGSDCAGVERITASGERVCRQSTIRGGADQFSDLEFIRNDNCRLTVDWREDSGLSLKHPSHRRVRENGSDAFNGPVGPLPKRVDGAGLSFLTVWAKMGAPLSYQDPLHRLAADRARLARPPVHAV